MPDIDHAERLDLDVAGTHALRAEDTRQGVIDLANEPDASVGSRQMPELSQERLVALAQLGALEQVGDVVAFRFLDIEADMVDALGNVEGQHLLRHLQTGA